MLARTVDVVLRRAAGGGRRPVTFGLMLVAWRIGRRLVARSDAPLLRFEVRPGETYLIRGVRRDR